MTGTAGPHELVGLSALMARGPGRPEVVVGLVDEPVALDHPALAGQRVRVLAAGGSSAAGPAAGGDGCGVPAGCSPCRHGTFVAGLLSAARSSAAPGICPGCTLLVRPVFPGRRGPEWGLGRDRAPGRTGCGRSAARVEELAAAIVECVDAGARVLNLSVAPEQPSSARRRELESALDYAAHRGVITVVAAGNQGRLGSSALTRHPWVLPVVAYDRRGRLMDLSNLGGSIGGRGVGGPGEAVTGLGVGGGPVTLTGTSVAVPFVVGTVALLLSEFPGAPAGEVRAAVAGTSGGARRAVVPPLLDARAAYGTLLAAYGPWPVRGAGRRAGSGGGGPARR
ncbi:hypothetical protein GCM10009760_35250 [Kitasatospora kazusensis]|uniref:Peptidase S8/S53 domain-containing protein n=1 Tax=Kitasatospora kazusensis TaxID=407974 RepID=A0ABN2ZRL7_9ACTN